MSVIEIRNVHLNWNASSEKARRWLEGRDIKI